MAKIKINQTQIEQILKSANLYTKFWWLNDDPKIWDMLNQNIQCYDITHKNQKAFKDAKKGNLVIGYKTSGPKKGQVGFTCVVSLFVVSRANNGTDVEYSKVIDIKNPFLSRQELLLNSKTQNIVANGKNQCSFKEITPDQFVEIILMMINKGVLTLADFTTAVKNIPSILGGSTSSVPTPVSTPKAISTAHQNSYNDNDFCKEVYGFDSARFQKLRTLLETKKNIILQGAPGVGKTYAAKRLAYAIMGEKDNSRIEFVQFHQNYAYENFVMGYKPNGNGGFDLTEGIFYNFCKEAEKFPQKPYFFIIDEINRGNLSKIFGELLMLIENDYRGDEYKVKLAYKDEPFSVPENLYIIGMMNTADRSLAMIDYALRRRFSFYDMKPEFDFGTFKQYQNSLNSNKFDKIITAVKDLNIQISKSLGEGFCIGHSYFCNLKASVSDIVLDNIINYEIIPMLKEYWFDDTETFERESVNLLNALK